MNCSPNNPLNTDALHTASRHSGRRLAPRYAPQRRGSFERDE